MAKKRYPLPKRFNAALSEAAYKKLRELSGTYGYGNNYLLTILLENLDSIVDAEAIDQVFADFASEYGSPDVGMKR